MRCEVSRILGSGLVVQSIAQGGFHGDSYSKPILGIEELDPANWLMHKLLPSAFDAMLLAGIAALVIRRRRALMPAWGHSDSESRN